MRIPSKPRLRSKKAPHLEIAVKLSIGCFPSIEPMRSHLTAYYFRLGKPIECGACTRSPENTLRQQDRWKILPDPAPLSLLAANTRPRLSARHPPARQGRTMPDYRVSLDEDDS